MNYLGRLRIILSNIKNFSFLIFGEYKIYLKHNLQKSEHSNIHQDALLMAPYAILKSTVGDSTYININSKISYTTIGKFCSIGPNFISGWGIHPINGISTSPVFYSERKQLNYTFCEKSKVKERMNIVIGNDVFIGANVMVLDGVTIGHGAVIGAGAIVSKDIPPYAVAVGNPIQVIKFRFSDEIIQKLLKIEWWDWDREMQSKVERYFSNVEEFIKNVNVKDDDQNPNK